MSQKWEIGNSSITVESLGPGAVRDGGPKEGSWCGAKPGTSPPPMLSASDLKLYSKGENIKGRLLKSIQETCDTRLSSICPEAEAGGLQV